MVKAKTLKGWQLVEAKITLVAAPVFFFFFFLLVSSAVGHGHDNTPTPLWIFFGGEFFEVGEKNVSESPSSESCYITKTKVGNLQIDISLIIAGDKSFKTILKVLWHCDFLFYTVCVCQVITIFSRYSYFQDIATQWFIILPLSSLSPRATFTETQFLHAAGFSSTSQKNSEKEEQIIKAIDSARLKIEEVISMEQHRDLSPHLAAAQALDTLREVAVHATVATTTSRKHITETDIEAEFGTRAGVETLTETGSHLVSETTTPSEIKSSHQYVTETDLKVEFGTRKGDETLTEVGSKFVSATTPSSDKFESSKHVTETNLGAEFGTTQGDVLLTEVDKNFAHRTTTSSETLTEMDPKNLLPTTTVASEVLTESKTAPAGLTTDASDTLTLSVATTSAGALEALTETAAKSATAASKPEDYATESELHAETTTSTSTVDEVFTEVLTTDDGKAGTDFRIPHTDAAQVDMTTEEDGDDDIVRTGEDGLRGKLTAIHVGLRFLLHIYCIYFPMHRNTSYGLLYRK